ncbi:hypothetical protein OH77DRAFT_413779 [Trametes cingulata]|nr:hypothetical protein OH77DRAFT_413779 [Trametes cingulata]
MPTPEDMGLKTSIWSTMAEGEQSEQLEEPAQVHCMSKTFSSLPLCMVKDRRPSVLYPARRARAGAREVAGPLALRHCTVVSCTISFSIALVCALLKCVQYSFRM